MHAGDVTVRASPEEVAVASALLRQKRAAAQFTSALARALLDESGSRELRTTHLHQHASSIPLRVNVRAPLCSVSGQSSVSALPEPPSRRYQPAMRMV